MRIFTNPYDAGEVWASSMGNCLRVGWLTEPRPVFDRLKVSAGTVSYSGWGNDSQQLQIQTSSDFAGWSDIATNIVRESRFGGWRCSGWQRRGAILSGSRRLTAHRQQPLTNIGH